MQPILFLPRVGAYCIAIEITRSFDSHVQDLGTSIINTDLDSHFFCSASNAVIIGASLKLHCHYNRFLSLRKCFGTYSIHGRLSFCIRRGDCQSVVVAENGKI